MNWSMMNILEPVRTFLSVIIALCLTGGWVFGDCVSDAKRHIFEGSYEKALEVVNGCDDPAFTDDVRAEMLALIDFQRGR